MKQAISNVQALLILDGNPPFLIGFKSRIYTAFSFRMGVIPPTAGKGRTLQAFLIPVPLEDCLPDRHYLICGQSIESLSV